MWEFEYTRSDYERVKYLIMDAIGECSTMEELMDVLTENFEAYHMVLANDEDEYEYEDDCECDGCCENCTRH